MENVVAKSEIDLTDIRIEDLELSALTIEQLEMIAGGECVVNSI